MLDKLKFWKKHDDDLDDLPTTPFPGSPSANDPFSAAPKSPYAQSPLDNRSKEIPHPSQMPPIPEGPPDHAGFDERKFDLRPQQSFDRQPPQQAHQQQATPLDQQLQMINIKLDGIKTAIENINMRLERLEHQQPRYR